MDLAKDPLAAGPLSTGAEISSFNRQPQAYVVSVFRVRLRLTVKRNTVQLSKVVGTFDVPQPSKSKAF